MGLFDFLTGGSESTSVTNPAIVDPRQQEFLQSIRSAGLDLAGQQFGQISGPGGAFDLSSALQGQGAGFLSGLSNVDPRSELDIQSRGRSVRQGTGISATNALFGAGQGVGGFAGQTLQGQQGAGGFLSSLQNAGQGVNPFLDQSAVGGQIQSLSDVLGRNQSLGLNEIQSRFGQAGTTGSRAGLAGAELVGNTQRALSSGVSSLLSSDIARRGQLALGQAGLQAQGAQAGAGLLGADLSRRQGAAGLAGQLQSQGGAAALSGTIADNQRRQAGQTGLLGLQTQGNLGGLSSLGDLFNLGLAPFQSQFAPLLAANSIIGPPTVLGQGGQSSSSGSGGLLQGINFGFGF